MTTLSIDNKDGNVSEFLHSLRSPVVPKWWTNLLFFKRWLRIYRMERMHVAAIRGIRARLAACFNCNQRNTNCPFSDILVIIHNVLKDMDQFRDQSTHYLAPGFIRRRFDSFFAEWEALEEEVSILSSEEVQKEYLQAISGVTDKEDLADLRAIYAHRARPEDIPSQ